MTPLAITKQKRDGTPLFGQNYGSDADGLGGPGQPQFTHNANGVKPLLGSVVYENDGLALQTWKVQYSLTASAWAEHSWWMGRDASAWIRYFYGNGSDARKATVRSDVAIDVADGEIVGEEVQQ